MFDKVEQLKKQLNKYRPLTTEEVRRLREEFLINFTYNSNAIEGSTLTLQETAMILKEGITISEKPLKEHLEAVAHKDAFYYIEELVKEKQGLSEKTIRDIQNLVLMDKPQYRGTYRRIPVVIQGAIHEPPQPFLVPIQMEQLIREYNEEMGDIHLIEKVALLHLKFEGIHPFIDGNGRTGRLLLNFELMKEGYPPVNIKFKDRRSYYNCFTDYQSKDNNSIMLTQMITKYLEEELEKYISILDTVSKIENNLL
ncbi:MAG: cell filamentation protein Fic [Firmicutes bacterium HGW-Firmicutes-7]|nr:MAG: cell filamentation protein Fic [Firmicutes bacterium HGW-Firmicutes-7]